MNNVNTFNKIEYYSESPECILQKANPTDACYDIRSKESYTIPSMGRCLIKTGIFIKLPVGWEMQIRPRSGLALKHGITVLNSPGTIDCGYTGEIGVVLFNSSPKEFTVNKWDRIAQAAIVKISQCNLSNSLKEIPSQYTSREGGFGSSGR